MKWKTSLLIIGLLVLSVAILIKAGSIGELIGDSNIDKETKKTNVTINYTPISKTTCSKGQCTTDFYATIKYVYEDKIWKNITDARSLKDSGVIIKEITSDSYFKINILDYNYTHVIVRLETKENGDIPVRIWKQNNTKIEESSKSLNLSSNYKEVYDKNLDSIEKFTAITNDKEKTYEMGFGKILEFGYNSTTITYNFNATYQRIEMKVFKSASEDGFGGCDIGGSSTSWGTNSTLSIDNSSEPMLDCTGALTDDSANAVYDSDDNSRSLFTVDDPPDNGGGWIFVATPSGITISSITSINWSFGLLSDDANLDERLFIFNHTSKQWYQCEDPVTSSGTEYVKFCDNTGDEPFLVQDMFNSTGSAHLGIFGDWVSDAGLSNNIRVDYSFLSITYTESSCIYPGSGDWNVLFSDYCNITDAVTGDGSNIIISGIGEFRTTANITGFKNVSLLGTAGSQSYVYCLNGGCFIDG